MLYGILEQKNDRKYEKIWVLANNNVLALVH